VIQDSPPANPQNPTDLPDASAILDLMEAFRRSKAMFAAVSLGVFDALEQAPADVRDLAASLELLPEPLQRLLDTCVALGLLRHKGEIYENEPVSSVYLCRASERALTGYILYSNQALFRLWRHLEDAVREGTPRWTQEFGGQGTIFDHFFRTPEAKQDFLKGMHGLGLLSSEKVVRAFDLTRFRHMLDLGGATGHLAIAACERYPGLRATVFDLPEVVEATQTYLRSCSSSARVGAMTGDFFNDPLPEADLFALGRILHDWPEAKIRLLLAKIYQRLPAGGGILIAEKLLDEDRSGPTSALLQSLNMLVCTEGKERTLSEYRELLEAAGFENVNGVVTGTYLDVILAFKR
jgi:acetylserotonin N-methyltransferase